MDNTSQVIQIEVRPSVLKLHPEDLNPGGARLLARAGLSTIVYADRVEIEVAPNGGLTTWISVRRALHLLAQQTTRNIHITFHTESTEGEIAFVPVTIPQRGWPIEMRTGKAA